MYSPFYLKVKKMGRDFFHVDLTFLTLLASIYSGSKNRVGRKKSIQYLGFLAELLIAC